METTVAVEQPKVKVPELKGLANLSRKVMGGGFDKGQLELRGMIKNEKKLLELLEADKQANEVRKIIELHSHREKSLKRKPTDESSM